jgi:hypothetical protein
MSILILNSFKERYPTFSKFFQVNLFFLDILSIVASISVLSITPVDNDCPSGSFRRLVTMFLISNSLSALEYLNFDILKMSQGPHEMQQFLLTRFLFGFNSVIYKILCVYSVYVLWNTQDICRFYSSKLSLSY